MKLAGISEAPSARRRTSLGENTNNQVPIAPQQVQCPTQRPFNFGHAFFVGVARFQMKQAVIDSGKKVRARYTAIIAEYGAAAREIFE